MRPEARSQTIARASAAMLPLQPSTFHDDAFHDSRVTENCGHRPVSDCSSDHIVCYEAVGPNSCCRLGRPILAASLPDIRPLAIRVV